MANVYYSKQWTDLTDGTVVAVKGGTAVIGTDAFATYSDAKENGDVVLCDVFANHDWADKSSGDAVNVELEGDSYTLNVGEQAFATLEAAAMQVATNQYGGVETYGGNYGITAYGYVSGAWSDLPDYTVVTTGGTVWDEDGATVSGGTAVIGVNAFATYTDASDKLDVYWDESELNGIAASSDIYLDSTWISTSYSESETITVTLADGSEVTATFGENAVLLTADTAQAQQEGVTAAANIARAKNSAIYLSGGTFSSSMSFGGCTTVIGCAIYNRDSTVNFSGTINLATESGTWVNTGTSTVNWDITNGLTQYATIKNFERYSNVGTVKQTITVTADQAVGNYTIATGDLSSLADNVKTFTITGVSGQEDATITVGGESVSYNDLTYRLANVDDEQLVLTVAGKTGPAYFSAKWAGLAEGTKVTVAGNTLTIGTDAFASYALAQASGASTIKSVDTYLNSTYNDTDPIVLISGYTATFGVDAFADQASAVVTAKSMGGALDVTGGSFSGLDVSGIGTSIFTDVTTDSLYLVGAAATVGGDVTATISGTSYLTKGLYAVDDGGSVGGDLTITVAGGEIYRRGIQICGTVGGTSSVTVTGDATISSITDAFDTVTINEGATLNYGIGLEGDWNNSYLCGFRNLVNNGTLNYNAELGQNTYAMLYETMSGTGTIELGDNVVFVEGGTTYVAEVQKRVMCNSVWSSKKMFDVIDVDDGTVIYGVSAFKDKEAAQTSGLTSDVTTFIEYGQVIEGTAHGEDGHLGFAGGTVTGTAFAGEEIKEAGGTITQSSELVALSTSSADGDYQDLFGGYDIRENANTTITADSSLTVGGEGALTGKMLVGGCCITAAAVDWTGTSNVTVTSGSFSKALVGGALVNGENASVSGTLNTDVTIEGGTVKELCGGCYLQDGGTINVSGTSNITLTNCTVVGNVIGGNSANKTSVSTGETSLWSGDTSITIDATKSVVIGGDLVAGSYGTGNVSGNTSITLSGSGDNLSIGGNITGDSSGGTPTVSSMSVVGTLGLSGKIVTGTRTLTFNNFDGTLGSADKEVSGFDQVVLGNSAVTLAGNGDLASVSDWQITDGTLVWTKGENDFADDQLTLTCSGELTKQWTVFQLTDKLTTGWDQFTTDGTGTAKIILSVNGEGTIAAFDDKANAYVGTISGEEYRFFLDTDDNSLKLAKFVTTRTEVKKGETATLVTGATYTCPFSQLGGVAVNVTGGTVFGTDITFAGNTATCGGAIRLYSGAGVLVFDGNVIFVGNTATMQKGSAIYNSDSTVNFSGTIDLATESDTWVNEGSSTVNWDITDGTTATITNFERYSNLTTEVEEVQQVLVKQTITVTADQSVGDYVIATGDLSDVTNKDTFTVKTADDETGASVKIKGAAVGYGKRIYSLTISDNGTPTDLTDDKLILKAEDGGTVLEITKAAGRGPIDDFLVYSRGVSIRRCRPRQRVRERVLRRYGFHRQRTSRFTHHCAVILTTDYTDYADLR